MTAASPRSHGSPRGTPTPRTRTGGRIMAPKPRPSRTEVCIIGAGASGAAAAKVLTERGVRGVALERGPWRGKETFGGGELANINRYHLLPAPPLNPTAARAPQGAKRHPGMFLPC